MLKHAEEMVSFTCPSAAHVMFECLSAEFSAEFQTHNVLPANARPIVAITLLESQCAAINTQAFEFFDLHTHTQSHTHH